uniref:Uncharacterized protein n=1 Tax=Cacopsylla melanoneura TaxID=428564 RepID=A0A8D8Z6W6_9HEMI
MSIVRIIVPNTRRRMVPDLTRIRTTIGRTVKCFLLLEPQERRSPRQEASVFNNLTTEAGVVTHKKTKFYTYIIPFITAEADRVQVIHQPNCNCKVFRKQFIAGNKEKYIRSGNVEIYRPISGLKMMMMKPFRYYKINIYSLF